MEVKVDLAVIGSGFGGSLCAMIAAGQGRSCVLLERGVHPRFALGESATPMADLILGELAKRYDIPELLPLTTYGSWRRTYPHIRCGLKRGFTYVRHDPGQHFVPQPDHANELLVAANPDPEHADTHWLREDVDAFFVDLAVKRGVKYLDHFKLESAKSGPPFNLDGSRYGEDIHISADFVIDASGDGGALGRGLALKSRLNTLGTNSYAVFSHFRRVTEWGQVYASLGGDLAAHPYPCDAAALHHMFEGGWMWVLRFDYGVTSAGFSLEPGFFPVDEGIPPERQWELMLDRYPSIRSQFAEAEPTMPVRRTGRLQRAWSCAAGDDWAMLPTAGGFIDALHSTGNAHTLSGIERLMEVLLTTSPGRERTLRLARYAYEIDREVTCIDRLVHGCYRTFGRFDRLIAHALLYFVAAIYTEHSRRASREPAMALRGNGIESRALGFLLTGDDRYQSLIARSCAAASSADSLNGHRGAFTRETVIDALTPWNLTNVGDPAGYNMYDYV